MRNVVALFAALAPAAVLACDPELAKRSAVNAARGLPERKTEAQAAAILNPQEECSYYNYEPVNAILDSYPAIWKTAHMNASGLQPDARQLFENISATIPDIPPRGGRYGDFQGIAYNYTADPDCWWSASHCMTPKPSTGLKPDLTHCEEPNVWVFSHDDGPNCSHNAFYDYMAERKQKATLFYIGSNVLDWPLEAQRGLADGHEICAHTWSHHMTGLTNEEVFAELYFAKKAIKEVLGITVRCWRPPYGDVDNRVRFIAEKLDLRTTMWKEDTDDWNWVNVGKPQIRANYRKIFADQAAGKFDTLGPVVLSHELNNGTMSLIDEFLPQMQEQFTGGVMPLAVCMNNSRPYIEQEDYIYPNYEQWRNGTLSVSLASPTAKSVKSIHLKPTATLAVATSSASSSGAIKSRASASKPSATAVSEHTSGAGATGPKAVGFGLTAFALPLAGILLV